MFMSFNRSPPTSDPPAPVNSSFPRNLTTGGDLFNETLLGAATEDEIRRQPNTALLCTILMLGTFFIAYFLCKFRNSIFMGLKARRALGDFGVPIAILTMVFLDYFGTDTHTENMKVPEGLKPSGPDKRSWVISPAGQDTLFSPYYAIGAVLPAMLIFILIFMTTGDIGF